MEHEDLTPEQWVVYLEDARKLFKKEYPSGH